MDSTESVGSLPKAFGRYRVQRVLGEGAMGAVYLAQDSKLDRQVALKVPKFDDDPDMMERFYREARAAATLHHRNICPVHDIGEIEGVRYISMAYIAGRPLSAIIDRERPQTERSITLIVRKLARALDVAHQAGIVHRDLKPENIMLDQQHEPVIMDFGIARRLNKDGDSRLTQSGDMMGSPAYMSPEQVRGDIDRIGPPSDIYSLGVILYELLTGELPFDGPTSAVFGQVLTQEPEKPSTFRPDLDVRLESICLNMMAKEIEQRIGTMCEVTKTLTDFLKSSDSTRITVQQLGSTSSSPAQSSSLASSGQWETMNGAVHRQTFVGQQASKPQTARDLRGPLQNASNTLISFLARMPGWAQGAIGTLLIIVLLYCLSLPFHADTLQEPVVQSPNPPTTAEIRPDSPLPVSTSSATIPPPSPAIAPFSEAEAKVHQQVWAKHLGVDVELTNGIGIKMMLIPPGEFTMGSTDSDSFADDSEKPQHRVKITKPFYLSVYEVTQQQYEKVMGTRPWQGQRYVREGPDYPATWVSWNDAVEFCRKLSEQEGEEYRLPTEAEWEYACRAGTTTIYSFGDDTSKLGEHSWYDKNAWNVDDKYAHGVGQKLPNRWGLFDMHGNVWEWCQDWRHAGYGSEKALTDPLGPAQGKSRVGRGGSFNTVLQNARSANRNIDNPASPWSDFTVVRSYDGGFRVARTYP